METSILSGRLNIVQTDGQKGIIPPLPSPPTLPSKPSGSHFSVTTEEEDQRGKRSATLLLTNHPVTLRPPLYYPSQVSSSPPPPPHLLVFGEPWRGMKSRGVNQAEVPLFISQKQGNAKGPALWNPLFCLFLGESWVESTWSSTGRYSEQIWRALQQTMVEP